MRILSKIIILFGVCYMAMLCANVSAAVRTDKTLTLKENSSSMELQKLLDYNQEDKYNLTIQVPAGEYYLYKELRIYSNTTIIADDEARFLKNHDKGAMIANDLTKDKGGYTTASNITVIGGIWDSSSITKGTESFRFIHASNITIQNATICNVPEGSKLILLAGVRDGKVDHCTLFGYSGTLQKEAIQLDIVHDEVLVPSMQLSQLQYDDLACDGITITNNEIFDFPRAVGSHTSVKGVFHKNITITDNNFHDIDEAAIKAYNYVNLLVSNNTIRNASVGVLVYTYIDNEKGHYLDPLPRTIQESLPIDYNITIEGNKIELIHQYNSGKSLLWGDGIRIMGSKERPLSGVVIKKNNIKDTKRMGIYSSNAPECYTGSNLISKTENHGIYMDKSCHSKVYYNKLFSTGNLYSTYGGIGISASKEVTAYKNVVKYAAKNGIFLYNGSTKCSINTNTIIGASDNGISINSNSNYALISNNIITGNLNSTLSNRGIFVYDSNYASIRSNTITDCKPKQGINTNKSTGSTVYKNTIY